MKILQINKFYFLNGGSEQYMFSLCDLLRQNGHEVVPFSMNDPRNLESEYNRYFIKNIDYTGLPENIVKTGYIALRTLYSIEAKKKINRLIKSVMPHIAHIHNFSYHLTPSILSPLAKRNIPVVQTLHDYHIICPSHNLYDFKRMQVCEDCRGRFFLRAVRRNCIKGSRLKSLIGSLEGYLAKFLHAYSAKIDLFISPSQFLRHKIIEHGVDPAKVIHFPNFVDPKQFTPKFESSNYFSYFGRLEEFKGVRTMFRSFSRIREANLCVLGEGSLRPVLEEIIAKEGLNNIHLLGFKRGEELRQIIQNSLCTIIPSEWFENNPISVLESFALGKPVVGASIGGIPELVEDGVNGFLFTPGSSEELSAIIDYCLSHRARLRDMGREARRLLEAKYNPDIHYRKLINLYKEMAA